MIFPGGSDGKASAYNVGEPGSIPGSKRSPGEGNGNPLQYSCLENPMDGGAQQATVHGVAKSNKGPSHSCRNLVAHFFGLNKTNIGSGIPVVFYFHVKAALSGSFSSFQKNSLQNEGNTCAPMADSY